MLCPPLGEQGAISKWVMPIFTKRYPAFQLCKIKRIASALFYYLHELDSRALAAHLRIQRRRHDRRQYRVDSSGRIAADEIFQNLPVFFAESLHMIIIRQTVGNGTIPYAKASVPAGPHRLHAGRASHAFQRRPPHRSARLSLHRRKMPQRPPVQPRPSVRTHPATGCATVPVHPAPHMRLLLYPALEEDPGTSPVLFSDNCHPAAHGTDKKTEQAPRCADAQQVPPALRLPPSSFSVHQDLPNKPRLRKPSPLKAEMLRLSAPAGSSSGNTFARLSIIFKSSVPS